MKYGFVIDNRKCIGCHACTVACKSENDVPLGVNRTWVKYVEKGKFPSVRRYFQVLRCNHCENPPCVTICPVSAMFKRSDGIVDFDPDRCIGCRTCMQACPYDAIHVDPQRHSAAKCNFCAHRIDNGIEPSCVVACPEHAIVAGDLDDPDSEIANLVGRQPVSVRKPEQGTLPKLFTIGGDSGGMVPTLPRYAPFYMWAQRNPSGGAIRMENNPLVDKNLLAAYHVEHLRQWGFMVPLFFWTKAIAAGLLIFPAAAMLLGHLTPSPKLSFTLSVISMFFLAITVMLIVADLSQWKRFYTILLRPQGRSWVAWGTIFLVGYSMCGGLFGLAGFMGWDKAILPLCWPVLIFGLGAAGYTAGLLSQCEGRDLWQNTILPIHFIIGAFLAGAAMICILPTALIGFETRPVAVGILGTAVIDHLLVLLGMFGMSQASDNARYAIGIIVRGPLSPLFWGVVVIAGLLIPSVMLLLGAFTGIAAALLLIGLLAFEYCFVMGGQGVPNS